MNQLAGFLLDLLQGLLTAIVPSPHRERIAAQRELHPPHWSMAVGLIQAPLGIGMFVLGGLAYLDATGGEMGYFLLENWVPGLNTNHFKGVGLIGWASWFVNPASWLFMYLGATGVLRCSVWVITRERVAEPAVAAVVFAWRAISGKARAGRRRRELGPPRPDVVRENADGSLTICSCRDKPDWNEDVTIEYRDRHYRLGCVEERVESAGRVIVFRLNPEKDNAVIRRLSVYDPETE